MVCAADANRAPVSGRRGQNGRSVGFPPPCLLYTSDAADERSSVDLGGRRIIKQKKKKKKTKKKKKQMNDTI